MDGFKYIFDNQTTHTGTANNEGALVVAFSEYCENYREMSLAPSPCCDAAVSRLCSPPLFVFTPGYSRNNSASRCQLCCSAVCTLENYSKHCRMTCPGPGPVSTLQSRSRKHPLAFLVSSPLLPCSRNVFKNICTQ